jgi:hypothetical protein
MSELCQNLNFYSWISDPFNLFLTFEILYVILLGLLSYLNILIFHKTSPHLSYLTSIFSFIGFFILLTIITSLTFIIIFIDDVRPTASYHVLNAAIKNTCILDPEKKNCPTTEEELIKIEPERFKEMTKHSKITYRYYPDTNQYTLIVRGNYLLADHTQVAMYDPRLLSVKNYGNGLDFYDARIGFCGTKYFLLNPPPFPGPWNEIN